MTKEQQSDSSPYPRLTEVLERLDYPFKSQLRSMYEGNEQLGSDGHYHSLNELVRISPEEGMWIYDLCLSTQLRNTLEIGLAYGFSTLFFLAAIAKNQNGKHTAIDPYQEFLWHGIGLRSANQHAIFIDGKKSFRFINDRSDRAATDLARCKEVFDIIFVDGNHRFDDVLVDFYLYAPLVAESGYIIFDDMWMSSVKSVVDYIRTNRRDFTEIASPVANAAIFQKVSEDCREWNDFFAFHVFPPASPVD